MRKKQSDHKLGERMKKAIRKEARSSPTRGKDHKIRVLLVDDHVIVRQSIAGRLAAEPDIEVVDKAASSGEMALELTRRVRPDVVVMDIDMAGIGGIEATRRIRMELPQVRIIGLSMHVEPQMIQAMRDVGADAYLTKEASIEELLVAIRKINVIDPAA